MLSRSCLIVAALLASIGCDLGSYRESEGDSSEKGEPATVLEPETPQGSDPSGPIDPDQITDLTGTAGGFDEGHGTWVVAGHSCPHICAMSNEEAGAWIGREVRISATAVSFADSSCPNAMYVRSSRSVDEFFRDWRVLPATLGIEQDPVVEVAVRCGGEEWVAPGSLLIVKGPGELLTVWDGVFFELRRSG